MVKYCPKCGTELSDGDQFCYKCGNQFSNRQLEKQTLSTNFKVTKKHILILIEIIVLIVALIGVITYIIPELGQQYELSGVNQEIVHTTSSGVETYTYYVTGTINNLPEDTNPYIIQTEFYDTSGNLIYTNTENLTDSKDLVTSNGQLILGYYGSTNKIEMDHADIKIMENGRSCGQTTYKFNMNNIQEQNLDLL